DSDGARYLNAGGLIVPAAFTPPCNPGGYLVFNNPPPMGGPVLDSLDVNPAAPNGNPPNIPILPDPSSAPAIFRPQGFVSCATQPCNMVGDNVGLWINLDAALGTFNPGDTGTFAYTLEATDDPQPLP